MIEVLKPHLKIYILGTSNLRTIQKTAWFFLLEHPVFRVMITKALELAKYICVDTPPYVGQELFYWITRWFLLLNCIVLLPLNSALSHLLDNVHCGCRQDACSLNCHNWIQVCVHVWYMKRVLSLMHASGYVSHGVGCVRFGVRGDRWRQWVHPEKKSSFLVLSVSPAQSNDNPHDYMMS